MIERSDALGGTPLQPGERFCFRCGPELSCFNQCCRNKRLPLLPYDMLRLRRALGLSSEVLLERYALLEIDPGSGWPALRLALDDEGVCPFVTAEGCAVYAHRPTCCRIYPLARAVRPTSDGRPPEEVFVRTEAPACRGWQEDRPLTTDDWVEDQGLAPYHRANNQLPRLLLHPRRSRPMRLSPRQVHGVVLGLYNLDVLRQLVASDGFGPRFGFSAECLARAQAEDEALLELGLDWLVTQFFDAPA